MSLEIGGPWAVGYLVGLAAIALFSKDRLNRRQTLNESGSERDNLVRLLLPGQLIRRFVFIRGVLFYFLILAFFYSVLAFLGSYFLPFLGDLVGPFKDLQPTDPIWPVGIALVMVGLLPEISAVSKLEEKARNAAYWLIGVPENFNDFTDRLMNVKMKSDEIPEDLLDRGEASNLNSILEGAKNVFGLGNDFSTLEQNAIKLWCFREWTQNPSAWPPAKVRNEFEVIKQHIVPSVLAVIDDLKAISDLDKQVHDGDLNIHFNRWKSVADRVNRAADQVCALFALFAERADSKPEKDNPISQMLRILMDRADKSKHRKIEVMDKLLLVMIAVCVGSFFAAVFFYSELILDRKPEKEYKNYILEAFTFTFGIISIVFPVIILTFWAQQRRNSKWVHAFSADVDAGDNAHFPTVQYARHALVVGLVVLIVVAGNAFYDQFTTHLEVQAKKGIKGDIDCAIWQFFGFYTSASRATCLNIFSAEFGEIIKGPDYIATIWFYIHNAVIGAISAVGLALVVDRRAAGQNHWIAVVSIASICGLLVSGVIYLLGNAVGSFVTAPKLVHFDGIVTGMISFFVLILVAILKVGSIEKANPQAG